MAAEPIHRRHVPDSRYDLSTYIGRVKHCFDITDMRTLFVSTNELERSKQLIEDYRNGKIPKMNDDLWKAKKIVDATLHPDTGEPVFLPFRMSCFVPV